MIINSNSHIKQLNLRPLEQQEIDSLHIPPQISGISRSITEIDGKYYYFKKVNSTQMINELIGSYLSKKMTLRAVDYQISIHNDTLFAISEIFFRSEFTYSTCLDLYGTIAQRILKEKPVRYPGFFLNQTDLLKLINNPDMLQSILKLASIDLKMGQTDRHNQNITLETSTKTGQTTLAPIYDFSSSYEIDPPYSGYLFYDNPFISLRKNKRSLSALCREFPEIIDHIEALTSLPITTILSDIEKENGITISEQEKFWYERKDKEYTKVLTKINYPKK